MHVNADEMVEALGPPSITIDGKEYRGRFVSADHFFVHLAPLLQRLREGKDLEGWEIADAVYQITRAFFPKPFWRVWQRSVAWKLLKLPLRVQLPAVVSFASAQLRVLGLDPNPTTPAETASDPPCIPQDTGSPASNASGQASTSLPAAGVPATE